MIDCYAHTYDNISRVKIDMIMTDLISQGAIVTGTNPWEIETNHRGIRLMAEWSTSTFTLTMSIIGIPWYVPCETAWSAVEAMMRLTNAMEMA